MQLVLAAGVNPRVNHVGPKVRIFEGDWKIVSEHQKDCKLVLVHDGVPLEVKNGDKFTSTGSLYHISVLGGTEEFINVFAELINGLESTATTR